MHDRTLSLAEQLLLLALDDVKGTVPLSLSESIGYTLAGAAIVDLSLQNRLEMEEGKLSVTDPGRTGDDVLDDVMSSIASSQEAHDARYWVSRLGVWGNKRRQEQLEERLVQRSIVRKEQARRLGILPTNRYPSDDAQPKQELQVRIRETLLRDAEPTPRTVSLISLARASGILNRLFTHEEWKAMEPRLNAITEGEVLGRAVTQSVAAVNGAIAGAIAATIS